jgi:branched-chain amino acid transport system ATP-binding protein
LLALKKVCAFYGKIQALWDVTFEIREGEIIALVGATAGKRRFSIPYQGSSALPQGVWPFSGGP